MGYEREMDYCEDISLTSSIEAVLGYSIHLSNLVGIHITYHIITHRPTAHVMCLANTYFSIV